MPSLSRKYKLSVVALTVFSIISSFKKINSRFNHTNLSRILKGRNKFVIIQSQCFKIKATFGIIMVTFHVQMKASTNYNGLTKLPKQLFFLIKRCETNLMDQHVKKVYRRPCKI